MASLAVKISMQTPSLGRPRRRQPWTQTRAWPTAVTRGIVSRVLSERKAVGALAIACVRQRRLVDTTEHSQGTHEASDAVAIAWEPEGRRT